MRRYLVPAVATAALALAACSQKTQDNAGNTLDSAAVDANATTRNAINGVDRAGDHAGDSLDRAGDRAGNALDRAGDATGNALDRAGAATSNAFDRASDATGNAMIRGGEALRR